MQDGQLLHILSTYNLTLNLHSEKMNLAPCWRQHMCVCVCGGVCATLLPPQIEAQEPPQVAGALCARLPPSI